MPTLYFVRHAKTTMNAQKVWSGSVDCELTQEGITQTLESFSNYSAKDFDVYFCSPLKRTKQTLNLIVENAEPTIIDERIIERNFGDWEGQPYSIIDEETTELYIQGKVQPPNGETYNEVKQRVLSFVTDLFNKYDNENILIVSHATILRMVRDLFLPEMEKKPIKNSQLLVISNVEFSKFISKGAI